MNGFKLNNGLAGDGHIDNGNSLRKLRRLCNETKDYLSVGIRTIKEVW